MKKILLIVFFLVLTYLSFPSFKAMGVRAQVNCATAPCTNCDLCGYCQTSDKPPQEWKKCCECMYAGVDCDNPLSNSTLYVNPDTSEPIKPIEGHVYTFLGCITTASGFESDGAAASVTQVLLDVIFSITGGIAFIYLIYGSFLILTSQANPERLSHGKSVVYGAIVGAIFSLSSVFIVNLLAAGILKIPGLQSGSP